jgi:hypothetical protein
MLGRSHQTLSAKITKNIPVADVGEKASQESP